MGASGNRSVFYFVIIQIFLKKSVSIKMNTCLCCNRTFQSRAITDIFNRWYYYHKYANLACSVECGLMLIHQDTHAQIIQRWYRKVSRKWNKRVFDIKDGVVISYNDGISYKM